MASPTERGAELRAAIATNKRDFDSRFAPAQLLMAQSRWTEAMDELLDILMRNKTWNEDLARKTYIAILDVIEPPQTQGRRRTGAAGKSDCGDLPAQPLDCRVELTPLRADCRAGVRRWPSRGTPAWRARPDAAGARHQRLPNAHYLRAPLSRSWPRPGRAVPAFERQSFGPVARPHGAAGAGIPSGGGRRLRRISKPGLARPPRPDPARRSRVAGTVVAADRPGLCGGGAQLRRCGGPDPHGAARHFIDYWMGPGCWDATPASRQPAMAQSIRQVRSWGQELFGEPTPLAALSALQIPMLLMTGGRSTASAHGVACLLRGHLPQVQSLDFAELGHMGPITHPGPVNAAIADFLSRL